MGNSSYQGKEWIVAFVQLSGLQSGTRSVLDIGPGQGTYYHLLKKNMPDSIWHGVEVFKPYIEKFNLKKYYDKIYNKDIRKYNPKIDYDLIIAGDVLEHMTKENAQELVNKLLNNCKWFIISIPIIKWEQDEINDNKYEIHIKDDWSHEEVISSFPNIKFGFMGSEIGVYALRGNVE